MAWFGPISQGSSFGSSGSKANCVPRSPVEDTSYVCKVSLSLIGN